MGTPEFAVAPLKALVEGGYNIVAVVTMPDKPAGRGHHVQYSAVKEYALSVGLPVLQPEKLKDETFIEELRSYNADLQIVVAFRMLPEVVWAMPRLGTFNLHASLLPQYRGAAPINWAVINGDKETGVTTFMLKHEIDTGNIILQERMPIGEDENVGSVHDRLTELGTELVLKTVNLIDESDTKGTPLPTTPQDEIAAEDLRPAPKIFKDTCQIRWSEHTLQSAYNFIRGLSPYPAAWTPVLANGKETEMKVFKASMLPSERREKEGSCLVPLPGGYLSLDEVQIAGKKRMPIADLLRGTNLKIESNP